MQNWTTTSKHVFKIVIRKRNPASPKRENGVRRSWSIRIFRRTYRLIPKSVALGMLGRKSYKINQQLIQNLWKMEPKSTENHEHRWLEALLDHLWHISGSKVVPGSILGRFGEAFWLHFGGNFRGKTYFCRCRFFIFFWNVFCEEFNGFWSSCSWLLGSKIDSESEKA